MRNNENRKPVDGKCHSVLIHKKFSVRDLIARDKLIVLRLSVSYKS